MAHKSSATTFSMYMLWNKTDDCAMSRSIGIGKSKEKYMLCSPNIDTVSDFRQDCEKNEQFTHCDFVILRGEFIAEEEL